MKSSYLTKQMNEMTNQVLVAWNFKLFIFNGKYQTYLMADSGVGLTVLQTTSFVLKAKLMATTVQLKDTP